MMIARKQRGAPIGRSIAALITAVSGHRDYSKILDTIAISIERLGDLTGAEDIRRLLDAGTSTNRSFVMCHNKDTAIRWMEPEDFDRKFFREGECGRRLDSLHNELCCISEFARCGIDVPSRILLHGPSGVGKTMSVRWLGWKLGLPVAVIELQKIVESHLGETAKKLAACIDESGQRPSILFLDEIDSICGVRAGISADAPGKEMARVTSTLLQRLDWLSPEQIVVAATNIIEDIDPALLRRLSTVIAFDVPSTVMRADMISVWLENVGIDAGVIAGLALSTAGLDGAAIRAEAMRVGRETIMARLGMVV